MKWMFRIAAVLAALAAAPQQETTEQDRRQYVDKKVGPAIEKGLEALRTLQRPSGRFDWFGQAPHGTTALAIYTFLASGGTLDETVTKSLDWLLNNPPMWTRRGDYDTYEFSLVAVALSYAIPHLKEGSGTR